VTKPKCLFILRYRQSGPYGAWNYQSDPDKPLASGLSVSAGQMVEMLLGMNVEAKLVQVIDNNSIDREVTAYKPTHVFIEAFWVVTEKFAVLKKLHPKVTWIVRNHSKLEFLAAEGGVVGWALPYIQQGVYLACNSQEATAEFKDMAVAAGLDPSKVIYLPNYYSLPWKDTYSKWQLMLWKLYRAIGYKAKNPAEGSTISIGCFGAIRPLKNHFNQAVAAILAASYLKVNLNFYVNSTRIEGKAEAILVALRALFKQYPHHKLIELGWQDHETFLKTTKKMDVVTQVSFSETFNIVAADAVDMNVPVVVSKQIPWLSALNTEYVVDPQNTTSIAKAIIKCLQYGYSESIQDEQFMGLFNYNLETEYWWSQFLEEPVYED